MNEEGRHCKEARMTQHNPKPAANTPVSERHHSDPPGLWAIVILSSFVIHLFVFGTLRLWLTLRINSVLAASPLIPIDVVAEASVATSPAQLTQTITSSATQNPASTNTSPKTPNSFPSRSTSSTLITPRPSPTSTPQESIKRGTSSTTNQSPASPGIPTATPSSAPNSAQNQPSQTQTPSSKPNLPTDPGNPPNGSTPLPSPSSGSSTGATEGTNSSGSQQGGIFISSLGEPSPISNTNEILHPNDPNYNDKLATLRHGSTQLSGDELKQLGITLEQELEIKVVVLIDETGKATRLRLSPQKLPDNLSLAHAEQLVDQGIAKLQFNPTLMAGQPVMRDYTLTLKISPNQK